MAPNPFLGVFFHWLGGLASASFYLPYRGVKRWSWETYWLAGGVFSWLVAPWALALILVPDLLPSLQATPAKNIFWAYVFGTLWGLGGLTFGLTMRYLGIALGMAVALGYCAVFGTLMPPIFNGEIGQIIASPSGRIILLGVLICVGGIAISGMAGMSKEHELSDEQKKASIKEFNFSKGMLVATFSGVMSSCFAYGLAAGKPLGEIARKSLLEHGRSDLWQNLPVLIVVLLGGFTTNFLWCVILNIKNGTAHEYLNLGKTATAQALLGTSMTEPGSNATSGSTTATTIAARVEAQPAPLLRNYIFCAVAGVTWYLQFFFYSMGQTKMGKYDFSSWTLHMASIIIFGTLWGVALKEWKGTSKRTHLLIALGLAVLIASTIVVGYGNFLKAAPSIH